MSSACFLFTFLLFYLFTLLPFYLFTFLPFYLFEKSYLFPSFFSLLKNNVYLCGH